MSITKADLELQIEILNKQSDGMQIEMKAKGFKIQNLEDQIKEITLKEIPEIRNKHKLEIESFNLRIKRRDEYVVRVLARLEAIKAMLSIPSHINNGNFYNPEDIEALKRQWDQQNTAEPTYMTP